MGHDEAWELPRIEPIPKTITISGTVTISIEQAQELLAKLPVAIEEAKKHAE